MSLVIYFACFTFIAAARVSSETLEPRRIQSSADDDNWIQDVRIWIFFPSLNWIFLTFLACF